MPSFSYVARDSATGREIRSSVDASSESNAVAALLNRNLMVVSIQEKIAKKGQTSGGRVPLADLVMFTRQLATMVDAGLAMVQSLQALAEQTENKVTRDVIKDITTRVEGGDSFSDALQKHPKVFNKLYFSMVSAGEKGGLLAEILARLATYLENTARLRKKVKSAMMYPTVVTIVAIGITIFLLVKVVPVFGDIFSQLGGHLPTPTQYLIKISNVVAALFLLFHPGRRGDCGRLALLHQDAGRAALFGTPNGSSCRFSGQSPTRFAWRVLPGRWLRWCAAACPSSKCWPSSRTRSATWSWRQAIKSAATDIERGRGDFHRLEQASRLSDHDHPHDDGRANKRAKSMRCWSGWPISWMKKSRTRSTG